jgi:SulP family sulfate permease
MKRDILAGLVVAAFALPLCLAFGAATGLGPGAGLITSIAAGAVAALLGGSRVQITGPTAIFIVVVTGIVSTHGLAGLTVAILLAGVLLVAFGALKLAPAVRQLPEPILVGFTAGIAVVLVVSQVKDLLGLSAPHLPVEIFARIAALGGLAGTTNLAALGLGLATVAVLLVTERWLPRVPWALVIVAAGAVGSAWGLWSVPTLGSAFGNLTPSLRLFDVSGITFLTIVDLLPAAFTLAFLGAVESLLSAGVADGLVSSRHSPHRELVGQGLGNAVSALVGGLPATGALGRTTVNIRTGGRSRGAALVHCLVLGLVWFFLGSLAVFVPLAVLAGIVVSVALTMIDLGEIRLILKTTRADAWALVITFSVTVAVDLAVAVISGLLVVLLFFVRGMAEKVNIVSTSRTTATDLPPGTYVVDFDGAFFFGAAAKFDQALRPVLQQAQTVLLRMDDVPLLDASGTRVLSRLFADARSGHVRVVMSGIQPSVLRVMEQAELIQALGTSNLFASFEGALRDIRLRQPLVFGSNVGAGCHDPMT